MSTLTPAIWKSLFDFFVQVFLELSWITTHGCEHIKKKVLLVIENCLNSTKMDKVSSDKCLKFETFWNSNYYSNGNHAKWTIYTWCLHIWMMFHILKLITSIVYNMSKRSKCLPSLIMKHLLIHSFVSTNITNLVLFFTCTYRTKRWKIKISSEMNITKSTPVRICLKAKIVLTCLFLVKQTTGGNLEVIGL